MQIVILRYMLLCVNYNGRDDDVYVIRLNNSGSMDYTFGANGKVVFNNITGKNEHDCGTSMYVDNNGKIYAAREGYNGRDFDTYVMRLNNNGRVNNSFSNNGKVVCHNIAIGNKNDYGGSL